MTASPHSARTAPREKTDRAPTTTSLPSARVKVLYIVGWGRSGSTIIDNLLGETEGFFTAGELSHIWQRGLIEGRRCGCGEILTACPVWSAVLATAFGDRYADTLDAHDVVAWRRDAVRVRHSWRLINQVPGHPSDNPSLESYVTVADRLYRAIAATTGARVVVDSTKRPSDAALLRLLPHVDAYYLHLVRDPRAVAYSWSRRKAQLDRNREVDMEAHSPWSSTISWLGWNLAAEALRRRHDLGRCLLVRYEDFVAQPLATVQEIVQFVGETPERLPFEDDRTVRLGSNHTVSGNPDRFKTGSVKLREDAEWAGKQPTKDRLLSTALALPLLHHYGYRLVPSGAGTDARPKR
jgi:hypothetical protein